MKVPLPISSARARGYDMSDREEARAHLACDRERPVDDSTAAIRGKAFRTDPCFNRGDIGAR
jgi:hypothetical protein